MPPPPSIILHSEAEETRESTMSHALGIFPPFFIVFSLLNKFILDVLFLFKLHWEVKESQVKEIKG